MHAKTLAVIYFDSYGLYELVAIKFRSITHICDDIHTNLFVPFCHYLYICTNSGEMTKGLVFISLHTCDLLIKF